MRRQRDMDLFRSLMLEIEDGRSRYHPLSVEHFEALGREPEPHEDAMSHEEAERLKMHLALVEEAGFVEFLKPASGAWIVDRITGKGHDFLDSVRDPAIWAKTKDGALAAGGWTLSLLGDLAKGFARQQIAKRTGVDL